VTVDEAGRLHWGQAWPVLLRPTGRAEVHLVHGSGGPLGGDELALDVEVATGASLSVRSAAATVVQPGPGAGARWDVSAAVGGTFYWTPEPTVVCDGAALSSVLRIDLAAGACAVIREIVILGRHGQCGGRYTGTLNATVDGTPLLVHTTVLDDSDRGLAGPGGTSGARAIGSLLLAGTAARIPGDRAGDRVGDGQGVRWAWMELDGPGAVLFAVGDPAPVVAVLDAFARGNEGPTRTPRER
jgi:urease accessory protein